MSYVAAAGLAIAAVSAAVGTYSAVAQSQAARASAEYQAQVAANNAKIASYNANDAISQGNQKLQAQQEQAAQQMGEIRAAMGASGVELNSGSALREQQGLAEVNQLNEATIKSNAARSAWNFRNQGNDYTAQAGLDTLRAGQENSASIVGGFSSLLSGASTFSNNYNRLYPSTPSATS